MQSGEAINLNLNNMQTGATVYVANQMPVTVTVSSVAISSMPAMTGTLSVSNFPQSQVVGGTVTVQSMLGSSNLPVYFASPQDVFLTNAGLDVSGSTVSVNVSTHMALDFGQNTVGAVIITDTQSNDAQVTGSGRLKVDGSGVTQPVSGTISVSGQVQTSTHVVVDNEVAASTHVTIDNFPASQAVTGTFFQSVQPVNGTIGVSNSSFSVTGSTINVNVDGTVPVSGTFFQATQPVSLSSVSVSGSSVAVQNFPALQAVQVSSSLVNAISLGTSAGKTAVLKTGSLVTTAVTANQVVSTYTVTAGKTFYLEYITASSRLTVQSATASILGTFSFQVSGTSVLTETNTNNTTEQVYPMVYMFTEPIPFAGGTGIAVVCTPASTTSMTWTANFGGYER